MSLSLSSLLNPSPDGRSNANSNDHSNANANANSTADQPAPTDQRRDSLPPISYVHSPEQQHVALPQYTPPKRQQQSSPPAADELHAAAKFATSSAGPPATWNGYSAANPAPETRRPSSGYDAALELPPPPPLPTSAQRKMSSPTLDQYHVSSRSPEQQRRESVISQGNAPITLPPLQHVSSPSEEHGSRLAVATAQDPSLGDPPRANGSAQSPSASIARATGGEDEETAPAGLDTSLHPTITSPTSHLDTSHPLESEKRDPSLAPIKEEASQTPQASSPIDAPRLSSQQADMDASILRSVSSLKQEHSMRNGSPLRESSVPMPSTEAPTAEPTVPRKRPAPKKKGTATTTKKAHPSKKRKLETARADSPASRISKTNLKPGSSKGTPANSSPAPSNRSHSAEPDDEDEEEGTPDGDDVYCLCRRPDTGTFMIGCDGTCDDWFHGKCVGIEERDKGLIDKYMCPNCSAAGIGKTTWKRICRRGRCRLPARIGKNKTGKEGSKYCSDECGVAFFREMSAAARGKDQATKARASRRKPGDTSSGSHELGARGGVLAPSEVRALLDASKSLDDFKKLGEGVLSPPATPDGKSDGAGAGADAEADMKAVYTDAERTALEQIATSKEQARARHQLLKDRLKFINMAKQAASRAVTEKELKPKDYCGFDPRLEWSEEQFAKWRDSAVGQQAFELDTLAIENSAQDADGDRMVEEDDEDDAGVVEVCDKKKCARHLEWAKLATDDVRFEMGDNSDRMRALDKEEREIKERAGLRRRAGGLQGEGIVEVHGLADDDGQGKGGNVGGKDGVPDAELPAAIANGDHGLAHTSALEAPTPAPPTPGLADAMDVDVDVGMAN